MRPLAFIAANWQRALPALVVAGTAVSITFLRNEPASGRALFAALLVLYMLHQIEEHLWPGGFAAFVNARTFHSGRADWPATPGKVAFVNIMLVWLPLALAVLFDLRWLGLMMVGVTAINALLHIGNSVKLRVYNPGLVTAVALFLPFTGWLLASAYWADTLSGGAIALILLAGVLLHLPVAALFVVPYLRARNAAPQP
jgi:hypothetical protein